MRRAATAALGEKVRGALFAPKPDAPPVNARPVSAEALKIRAREQKWKRNVASLLVKGHLRRQLASGLRGLRAVATLSWLAARISLGALNQALRASLVKPSGG